MEKSWKFACLCLIISLLKLCNGLPIHERTITDPHVQFATGLVAIVLAICALLFLTGCLCCRRFKGFQEFRDSPIPISTTGSVDNGLVNPTADGAFTIFAPLSQHNNVGSNPKFNLEDYIYGDINVSSWFNEGEHDFQRSKLKYIRELGKGWFGRVVEGTAQNLENKDGWTSVVVRILDSTASTKQRIFFLHEADIYRCGEHTNILKLYGRCLDSVPLLLLQEFCPQGDLKSYLLSNKTNQKNLLASEYPLIWCCQITSAVKFLHEKGLAHSDLACRNCQLTSNLTLKLGDYGLSPTKYPEDYYEGVSSISVRWCAPESLRHTNTTIQSERVTREANVWTLAVCFWEVCECGKRPYQNMSDDEVVTQVLGKANARLPRPSHGVLYTDYIYSLMQSCWLTPESRPTPTQIYLTLTDLLQVFTVCKAESQNSITSTQDSQESFDMRWNSLKPNNLNNGSDTSTELMDDVKVSQMSPSMNNLIGSLEDVNRSRNFDDSASYVEPSSAAPPPNCQTFEFKLGPSSSIREPPSHFETDSLNDSMIYSMRRSSSSETEEENWKTKIERGAYTEKVRQKSRSVTDLMVLTHIDCSESESETPLPSLDMNGGRAVNYRNVRLAPKNNSMEASYVHGSEGNLLSVQDDFQAELKKLQEEHRDSLFFVPDKFSRSDVRTLNDNNVASSLDRENDRLISSSERLIDDLNGTSEMKPSNQVYNVFKVTIDKLSPVHIVKLNEIINLEEPTDDKSVAAGYEVPKLCDIIENNNSNVSDFLISASSSGNERSVARSVINEDVECDNDICVRNVETYGAEVLRAGADEITSKNKIEEEERMISNDDSSKYQTNLADFSCRSNEFEQKESDPTSDEQKVNETKTVENEVNQLECKELRKNQEQALIREDNVTTEDESYPHMRKFEEELIKSGVITRRESSNKSNKGKEEKSSELLLQMEHFLNNERKLSNSAVHTEISQFEPKNAYCKEEKAKSEVSCIGKNEINPSFINNQQTDEKETQIKLDENNITVKTENHVNKVENTNGKRSKPLNMDLFSEREGEIEQKEFQVEDVLQNKNVPNSNLENEIEDSKEPLSPLQLNYKEQEKIEKLITESTSKKIDEPISNLENEIDVLKEPLLLKVSPIQSNINIEAEEQDFMEKITSNEFDEEPTLNLENEIEDLEEPLSLEVPTIQSNINIEVEEQELMEKLISELTSNNEELDEKPIFNLENEIEVLKEQVLLKVSEQQGSMEKMIGEETSNNEKFDEKQIKDSVVIESEKTGREEYKIELSTISKEDITSQNKDFIIEVRNISPETDVESVNILEEIQEIPKNSAELDIKLINEAEIVSNEETQWLELGSCDDNKEKSKNEEIFSLELKRSDERRNYIESREEGNESENGKDEIMKRNEVPEKNRKQKEEKTKSSKKSKKLYQVPKLIELIENNDLLMDYIIANYESELHDDLSWENSCKTNSIQDTTVLITTPKRESKISMVNFDVSDSQEASNPNSLTHVNVFSASKTKHRSLDVLATSTPSKNSFSSLRDVDERELEERETFPVASPNLDYSLETWDNFLGDAIDSQNQNINDHTVIFGSLNSEPRSLAYETIGTEDETEDGGGDVGGATPPNSDMESSLDDRPLVDVYADHLINIQRDDDCLNDTYVVDERRDSLVDVSSNLNDTFNVDDEDSKDEAGPSGTWESSGGWFLHPQSCANVSGQMTEQKGGDSYVRFGMDEEILAALRGELLAKLPHAQGSAVDKTGRENEEEWETEGKDEVFLRYNVYNTPLSPIPEESEDEDMISSDCSTPGSPASNLSEDDWPEKMSTPDEEMIVQQDNESQSLKAQGFQHQQTLSQDSCCSNDTLFNLEEMTCVAVEQEKEQSDHDLDGQNEKIKIEAINYFKCSDKLEEDNNIESPMLDLESPLLENAPFQDKNGHLVDFLDKEREHASFTAMGEEPDKKWAAPLPSPDERPWRQLSESLMLNASSHKMTPANSDLEDEEEEEEKGVETSTIREGYYENVATLPIYANLTTDAPNFVDVDEITLTEKKDGCGNGIYENVKIIDDDVDNEVDYVNIGNMENDRKMKDQLSNVESVKESFFPERTNVATRYGVDKDVDLDVENDDRDSEIYGVLTDIRFSGPGESHLMSTSFSESNNDPNNEQDWDSGSDTRSSSSGEFIWKEGEHEESLKALQALPQDTLDDLHPKNKINEDTSSESSCSDEEGECPEFIPSAWDKYATPTKSALRSPEKTLEKEEKKKGVWFKKQRYHCVYEYPREPDSPVLQSFDLWNSPPAVTTYPEWYFDIDSGTEFSDFGTSSSDHPDTNDTLIEFRTNFNDEFYITSSATPFDTEGGGASAINSSPSSSQFFPGGDRCWFDSSKINDNNTTPDSGVEDITPGSLDGCALIDDDDDDNNDVLMINDRSSSFKVPSLKMLAESAYARTKRASEENRGKNDILGGLRHTRDKLKLDLPPSPNTFTSNKTFNLDDAQQHYSQDVVDKAKLDVVPSSFDMLNIGGANRNHHNQEPVVLRERPAFTTFGKSRFSVQHVDTPDDKEAEGGKKNVCFEALPYRPPLLEKRTSFKKCKREEKKGEAGVLDSADEDSGIESSTLERKTAIVGEVVVNNNKIIVDL